MLKKSASFVLASHRGSTYRSVRLASSLTAALLGGLFEHPEAILTSATFCKIPTRYCVSAEFFRSLLGYRFQVRETGAICQVKMYDIACHYLSVLSDSMEPVSSDSIASERSSPRSSPNPSPIVFMNRAMLCGSFSSSPARLLGSAKASRRASSDFGEANRDRIRSTRALVQWEQAAGA